MDANPQTVLAAMRNHGVSTLIHGHTHRPAVHELDLDGKPARRIVLAEWIEKGQALCWRSDNHWMIENLQ